MKRSMIERSKNSAETVHAKNRLTYKRLTFVNQRLKIIYRHKTSLLPSIKTFHSKLGAKCVEFNIPAIIVLL